MSGRLAGKSVVVIGAGQTPGDTIGNGRAISILFARKAPASCARTAFSIGPKRLPQ